MSDLHSIVRRIETLHAERDGIAGDIADLFQEAKDAKLDLPALRLVIAERRRRAKNPSAYEALKGTAAEYLDALDNGVVVEHALTRARARSKKSTGSGVPHVGSPLPAAEASHLSSVLPVEPVPAAPDDWQTAGHYPVGAVPHPAGAEASPAAALGTGAGP